VKKTSIGTAVHLHPPGTAGDLCRWHNRGALATTIAEEALRRGLGPDASDAALIRCAELAKGGVLTRPVSPETLAATRSALRPALHPQDATADVAAALFAALPDKPLRVADCDGQEFLLVPIPVT